MDSMNDEPARDAIGDDFATWLGRQDRVDVTSYFAERQRIEDVEPVDETVVHRW